MAGPSPVAEARSPQPSSPPEDNREIAQFVERLRIVIASLEHAHDALEARIGPVLCAPIPCAATGGTQAPPVMSPLAQCLSEFESRVRAQANRVGELNQRAML